ncbi:MAG: MotA/TolQ/ExbB proton channel family protein [Planctomycetota bacterium]
MIIEQIASGIGSASLWAQTAASPANIPSPPTSADIGSVWDFVVKGGPVMIPIGICSLVALSVIIERMVSLRRRQIIPPNFVVGLKAVMGDPKRDSAKALEYCAARPGPLAGIFTAAIKKLGEPLELLERAIQEAGRREIFKLRKFLRSLGVVGSVAPLLGLLGTIFGMISAFQTVAVSGESLGRTELLAKGIYEALITTAAGLIVAIPTVIAHHMLSAKVERLVFDMDAITIDFVEEYASSPKVNGGDNGRAASKPERTLSPNAGDGRLPINVGPVTEGVAHAVANG